MIILFQFTDKPEMVPLQDTVCDVQMQQVTDTNNSSGKTEVQNISDKLN